MQVYGDTAAFFHPDGQVIEMTSKEWTLLARAVGLLIGHHEAPAPSSPEKPSSKLKAGNGGSRWTEDDDANLLHRWEAGDTVDDLIARFERSAGGITSRLVRLRIAQNRDDILAESRRRRRARLAEKQEEEERG